MVHHIGRRHRRHQPEHEQVADDHFYTIGDSNREEIFNV